jgi:hypothetical protein
MHYLHGTQNTQHHKPQQHNRSKCRPHHLSTKLLKKEQQNNNTDHDNEDQIVSRHNNVCKGGYQVKALDSRCNGDGWCNNTIGQ